MEQLKADICVIGAGSGGLSVAAGAAQMGASVVLVERGEMGGDCLNTGCVPSKSLLAAAKAAAHGREATDLGIEMDPVVDFSAVHTHVRDVIASIAPHDSVERFEALGVHVIKAEGRFVDTKTLQAGDSFITAKRFVVATGSRAAIPPIQGLDEVAYLTNESVFDLTSLPKHLVVIGGGPIGCEMAQAFVRLGSQVTLLEAFTILPKDDPDLVAVVRAKLAAEGVDIREQASVEEIREEQGRILVFTDGGQVTGSHLLIATGRRPNVEDLDLDAAGIVYERTGIKVDKRLRTSNKRVFAIGDVAGGYQFTHAAGYHAGIVIQNALFRLPAKVSYRAMPWVTYTDPELAHIGRPIAEVARDKGAKILSWNFSQNDRARAERQTDGMIKVAVCHAGYVQGVSIVGAGAGDLLQPWALMIANRMKIRAMTGIITPYPTRSEINKSVAGSYFTPTLYSGKVKRLVKILSWLP